MAGRLLSASFLLTVYNRNRDKAAPFAERGRDCRWLRRAKPQSRPRS